jgi:hypothetical protein
MDTFKDAIQDALKADITALTTSTPTTDEFITISESLLVTISDDVNAQDDLFYDLSKPRISKAQAVRLIDKMHAAIITANGLPDLDKDYRGSLEENIRANWTPDAIARGRHRGSNRYSKIPVHRSPRGKNCHVTFNETDVMEWFDLNIKPELLLKSTHAKAA